MLAENRRLQIPVMTGSTTNEHFNVIRAKTLEEFERNARILYGEYADEFLELCDFKCGDLEKILASVKVSGSPFGRPPADHAGQRRGPALLAVRVRS